jgi:hypothetical protein
MRRSGAAPHSELLLINDCRDLHRHEDHDRLRCADPGPHRQNHPDDAFRRFHHGLRDLRLRYAADRLLDAPAFLQLQFHGWRLRD